MKFHNSISGQNADGAGVSVQGTSQFDVQPPPQNASNFQQARSGASPANDPLSPHAAFTSQSGQFNLNQNYNQFNQNQNQNNQVKTGEQNTDQAKNDHKKLGFQQSNYQQQKNLYASLHTMQHGKVAKPGIGIKGDGGIVGQPWGPAVSKNHLQAGNSNHLQPNLQANLILQAKGQPPISQSPSGIAHSTLDKMPLNQKYKTKKVHGFNQRHMSLQQPSMQSSAQQPKAPVSAMVTNSPVIEETQQTVKHSNKSVRSSGEQIPKLDGHGSQQEQIQRTQAERKVSDELFMPGDLVSTNNNMMDKSALVHTHRQFLSLNHAFIADQDASVLQQMSTSVFGNRHLSVQSPQLLQTSHMRSPLGAQSTIFSNKEELLNSSMNSALFGRNGLINTLGRNQFRKKRFSSQVSSPRMVDSKDDTQPLTTKDVIRRIQAIQNKAGILSDPDAKKKAQDLRDSDQSPLRATNLQAMPSQPGAGKQTLQLPPINVLQKNATVFNSFERQRNSSTLYKTINLDLQPHTSARFHVDNDAGSQRSPFSKKLAGRLSKLSLDNSDIASVTYNAQESTRLNKTAIFNQYQLTEKLRSDSDFRQYMNVLSNHISQTQRLIHDASDKKLDDLQDVEQSIRSIQSQYFMTLLQIMNQPARRTPLSSLGSPSIFVKKDLKQKVAGKVKPLHALTPFELRQAQISSSKALADGKYLKELQLKEQKAEKRLNELLKKLQIPDQETLQMIMQNLQQLQLEVAHERDESEESPNAVISDHGQAAQPASGNQQTSSNTKDVVRLPQRLDNAFKSNIVSKKHIGIGSNDVTHAFPNAQLHTSSGSYLETKEGFQSQQRRSGHSLGDSGSGTMQASQQLDQSSRHILASPLPAQPAKRLQHHKSIETSQKGLGNATLKTESSLNAQQMHMNIQSGDLYHVFNGAQPELKEEATRDPLADAHQLENQLNLNIQFSNSKLQKLIKNESGPQNTQVNADKGLRLQPIEAQRPSVSKKSTSMHLNTYQYEKLVNQVDEEQQYVQEESQRSKQEVFGLDANLPKMDKSNGKIVNHKSMARLGLLRQMSSTISPPSPRANEVEDDFRHSGPLVSPGMKEKKLRTTKPQYYTPAFEPKLADIGNFVNGKVNNITSPTNKEAHQNSIQVMKQYRRKSLSKLVPEKDINALASKFEELVKKQKYNEKLIKEQTVESDSELGYKKFAKTFAKPRGSVGGRSKLMRDNLTQLGPDGRVMVKYVFNDVNLL